MRRLSRRLPPASLAVLAFVLAVIPSPARAEAPFNFDHTPGKLPKDVVPVEYDLTLSPNIGKRTFTGSEKIALDFKKSGRKCVLNAKDLAITAAVLTSADADTIPATISLDADAETCTLTFPAEIPAGSYHLALTFSGKINSDGGGLFASTYTNADGKPETMLCTQMEPTDARRMFPCWDEPSFRAKFHLEVDGLPNGLTAVANMPAERIIQYRLQPEAGSISFQTTPPMASYLVVLAIGNFDTIEGKVDGTKIHVIAPKGRVQNGKYALESAEKILHYYNDYFGVKFPLPKLDLIAVSGGGSFGGAMENWGGIVFAENALLYDPATSSQTQQERIFEVIAHEMAHQWFGDLVTMGWWDNLWLNEGFAEWMGESTTDHFNPGWQYWAEIARNKDEALTSDALSTTHPIQQPVATEADAERAFDEITYNKGQSFIRMLENYLGHDKFRDGLRAYMKAHAYGNTTTADLWSALDTATGQPVSAIAAGWTEQPGYPLVSVSRDPAKPTEFHLSQKRFTVHDPQAAPLAWKIPVTYSYLDSDSPNGRVLLEKERTEPADAGKIPAKFNVAGTGYYRVQYDEGMQRALLDNFGDLSAPDQSNLLSDAWAAVRANSGSPKDLVAIVQALRPVDTNPLVWTQVCRLVDTVDALYVGGDQGERKTWHESVVAMLNPVFEHYGWDAGADETAPTKELRARLIRTLGFFGDALVIEACQERFHAYTKDPTDLSPDIRSSVCDVVGRYADAPTYDALLAQARNATSDEQKQLFYLALSCADNSALADRTLALAATDEIQGSFTGRLVAAVAGQTVHAGPTYGEHPAEALKFAVAHEDALTAKINALAKEFFIPNLYEAFHDAPRADELEAAAKSPGAGMDGTQVKKAAEIIRANAELKTRLLPQINHWVTEK